MVFSIVRFAGDQKTALTANRELPVQRSVFSKTLQLQNYPIAYSIQYLLLGSGCDNAALVGNGFCNDDTNIAECDYDGGDCCPHPNMVGDAICHDETNHPGCNYDGGDCCVNVNTDSCSDCNCLGSGVITSPGFPGLYDHNLDLTWLIQVQMGQTIEIAFLSFDLFGESFGSGC